MEIFKIIAIGLCTVFAGFLVKNIKAEFGFVVFLTGGLLIALLVFKSLGGVFSSFGEIVAKTGLPNNVFKVMLKTVGIGYLTEFSAGICSDFGAASIANFISLGGKIAILIICFPIIKNLLELVVGLVA